MKPDSWSSLGLYLPAHTPLPTSTLTGQSYRSIQSNCSITLVSISPCHSFSTGLIHCWNGAEWLFCALQDAQQLLEARSTLPLHPSIMTIKNISRHAKCALGSKIAPGGDHYSVPMWKCLEIFEPISGDVQSLHTLFPLSSFPALIL